MISRILPEWNWLEHRRLDASEVDIYSILSRISGVMGHEFRKVTRSILWLGYQLKILWVVRIFRLNILSFQELAQLVRELLLG